MHSPWYDGNDAEDEDSRNMFDVGFVRSSNRVSQTSTLNISVVINRKDI